MRWYIPFVYLGIVMEFVCFVCPGPGGTRLPARGDLKKVEPDRLCVTIWPKTTRVKVKEYFDVSLRVVNATDKPLSLRVLCGGEYEHWKTNNTRISPVGWESTRKFPVTIKLNPGEAYEETLQMWLYDGPPQLTTSFQMGFTPLGEKQPYWSNRVVLGIKPGKRK